MLVYSCHRAVSLSFFPHKAVYLIIASVGSGKSTLLKAILGEIENVSGTRRMRRGIRVAFCDQEPWLLDQSVKENIVGSRAFDQDWYDRVVDACALAQDITGFAEGDATGVGSGGSALSGGQKSRVVSDSSSKRSSFLTTSGPRPCCVQQARPPSYGRHLQRP